MTLWRKRRLFFAAIAALTIVVAAFALHHADEEALALSHFFGEMDDNHDGQVDEVEAKKYIGEQIGGREFDSPVELTEAFQHMVTNMDKDDEISQNTISEEEVKHHLENLQHAVSVKEWVQHGLELPQYAERFRENVITAADFPLLVTDEGKVLEEELQIAKRLHRNQIVRGMKRLILGLGELPTSPQIVGCWDETATQTRLQWEPPLRTGQPPVHKYVIESLELDRQDTPWTLVSEVEAISQRQYTRRVDHGPGKHIFRIVAWTLYGHSPYVIFHNCLPRPQAASNNHMLYASPPSSEEVKASDGVSAHSASTHGMNTEKEMTKAGYWSVFVIAVTIALRILTTRNIAMLKCCVLFKLEKLALALKLHSFAQRLRSIKRRECDYCKAHHHCCKTEEDSEHKSHPPLVRNKAISHKIEPTQHFSLEESYMVPSKSSPALGDPNIDYTVSEWDANEAMTFVEKLPIPEYQTNVWDDGEGPERSQSLLSQSSVPSDVQHELIEGQCAYEGCVREWKGMLKFRNRWSRHFCSVCLRTYCYEHTHFSSHGSFGYCGQHSSCVCERCFPRLNPAVQAQLEATNKLDKSLAKKADLERGCGRREHQLSVRSILRLKKHGSKNSKVHPERQESERT